VYDVYISDLSKTCLSSLSLFLYQTHFHSFSTCSSNNFNSSPHKISYNFFPLLFFFFFFFFFFNHMHHSFGGKKKRNSLLETLEKLFAESAEFCCQIIYTIFLLDISSRPSLFFSAVTRFITIVKQENYPFSYITLYFSLGL